jgi:hypothetical protein
MSKIEPISTEIEPISTEIEPISTEIEPISTEIEPISTEIVRPSVFPVIGIQPPHPPPVVTGRQPGPTSIRREEVQTINVICRIITLIQL